ncbi:MAG: S-layer homology domain-containing protein [Oscillospiraceae bacterium]|nr:S-layer homology domain-containing protein [Oscillospiraceae bacterium]
MLKRIMALLPALLLMTLCSPPARAAVTESRSYLYAGSTSIYIHNTDRAGGNLNLVCPDYFEVGADGDLVLTRAVDPVFLSAMRARGVKVLPFVSNHWNRARARLALAKYEIFADQIAAQVINNGLDGVDIDIENIDHTDRAAFTAFMRYLRQKLPKDKLLSVAVAANPWGGTVGWQGAYDYAQLGQICDIIFIMTYDESYQGGSAGPVASYRFIKDSLDFALKSVDKSKVMMGVPFYGRYWVSGAASGGAAFTISDIEQMVGDYRSVTWYDGVNECARAEVIVTAGDLTKGLWGSKRLTPGVYDIWYESPRSLEKKLSLVYETGIRGAGSWALGFEPEEFWDGYAAWLYPTLPFTDIKGHWARAQIAEAAEKGIVSGYNRRFTPDGIMTRAEMVALVCKLAGVPPSAAPSGFSDTAGHWADGYISAMRDSGTAKGVGGSLFAPDRPVTRQEACVLVESIIRGPDTLDFNEHVFPDVTPENNPWSNNAIIKLYVYGVVGGDPSGFFRPLSLCTRAEAAVLALKAAEMPLKIPSAAKTVIEPR